MGKTNVYTPDRYKGEKITYSTVLTICPNCGELVFGSYNSNKWKESLDKELIKAFRQCPKCRKKLGLQENKFDIISGNKITAKSVETLRQAIDKEGIAKQKETILNSVSIEKAKLKKPNKSLADKISSDPELLKQYLGHLIDIESAIYYAVEKLANFKVATKNNNRDYTGSFISMKKEIEDDTFDKIDKLQERIKRNQRNIDEYDRKNIDDSRTASDRFIIESENMHVSLDLQMPVEPTKPVFNAEEPTFSMEMPTEPIYKKPRFFNKKAVEEENADLRQKYNTALEEYNQNKANYELKILDYQERKKEYDDKYLKYQQELVKYNNDITAYNSAYALEVKRVAEIARKNRHERFEKNRQDSLEKFNATIKKSEDKIADLEEKEKITLTKSEALLPEKRIGLFLDNEIENLNKELKTLCKTRNELYSLDVIYSKYRNLVAITTFYEYLDSGRCKSLSGDNGAYNLYENEVKANEVISKLTQIADTLESIKSNQFLLYTQLREINKNVIESNKRVDKVISELISMNAELSSISGSLYSIDGNTESLSLTANAILDTSKSIANSSALTAGFAGITAYYSKENAYYSKLNAQLTDSLGFMLALK